MTPQNFPLFLFMGMLYSNQYQTLYITKIDRGQIQFREGTEPKENGINQKQNSLPWDPVRFSEYDTFYRTVLSEIATKL